MNAAAKAGMIEAIRAMQNRGAMFMLEVFIFIGLSR
jgi:hypothetical protein